MRALFARSACASKGERGCQMRLFWQLAVARRVVQQLVKTHVVPNLLRWQHVAGVACCWSLHGYPFLQRLHGVLWY